MIDYYTSGREGPDPYMDSPKSSEPVFGDIEASAPFEAFENHEHNRQVVAEWFAEFEGEEGLPMGTGEAIMQTIAKGK